MSAKLTATPIDAGIYPDVIVRRYEPNGRFLAAHTKGGWIELLWESVVMGGVVTDNRTIQVSKVRALQAMSELARMEDQA